MILGADVSLSEERFDLVISNPPFGKSSTSGVSNSPYAFKLIESENGIEPSQRLVSKQCLSALFLGLILDKAKDNGTVTALLPSSITSNASFKGLRQHLMQENYIQASISLPSHTFYHTGTSVSTSVLSIEKSGQQDDVFMAVIESIGWDTRGRQVQKNDIPLVVEAFREFSISR